MTELIQERKRQILQQFNAMNEVEDALGVIAGVVESVTGTKFVGTTSQKKPIPDSRKLFAMTSKKYTKASHEVIGGFIGRDHSSVSAMLREGNKFLEVDPDFKQLFQQVDEKLPVFTEEDYFRNQFRHHVREARRYLTVLRESESVKI